MSKIIFITIIAFLLILMVWFGEKRKFYPISNTTSITVWKTYNNISFIIPGKYYGIFPPEEGFIKTSNTNLITIYISKLLPNTFIYQVAEKIERNDIHETQTIKFKDFDKDKIRYVTNFFKLSGCTMKDLKEGVSYIDLDIREDYARTRDSIMR